MIDLLIALHLDAPQKTLFALQLSAFPDFGCRPAVVKPDPILLCLSATTVICGIIVPPPLCPAPPFVLPPGGVGAVTWSTQNFSLRLTVLLCG